MMILGDTDRILLTDHSRVTDDPDERMEYWSVAKAMRVIKEKPESEVREMIRKILQNCG